MNVTRQAFESTTPVLTVAYVWSHTRCDRVFDAGSKAVQDPVVLTCRLREFFFAFAACTSSSSYSPGFLPLLSSAKFPLLSQVENQRHQWPTLAQEHP